MTRALLYLAIAACGFDSSTKGGPNIGGSDESSSDGGETTETPPAETSGESSTGPGPIEGPAKQRLTLAPLEGLGGAPLLVALDEVYADLAFVGPDMAPLAHEVESETRFWVRLPDPAPDHIWMTYDTGAPAAPDPAAVWDGFEAVWHFAESPADSTGNGWAVNPGGTSYADGIVGGGLVTTDDAHAELADGGPPLTDALTVEAWVRMDNLDIGAARFVAVKQDAYFVRAVEQTLAQPRAGVRLESGPLLEVGPSFTLATGSTWNYVVLTYDGAEIRMFVDGEQVDADTAETPSPVAGSDTALELGHRLPATLDEIRISTTARSPPWIAAQYASVSDDVITFGPPEPL